MSNGAKPPKGDGSEGKGQGSGADQDGLLDAEIDSLSELLDGAFGEALGDLLGAPPPLPPPPDDQVMTSAPRPARISRPPISGPIPTRASSPPVSAPTDEEVFGSSPGSGEFDAAFARAGSQPETPADGDEPFAEDTRIAAVDDGLLQKARAPSVPPVKRTPPPPPRATIVRRDQLGRERPSDGFEGDSTRIADPGYVAQVAQEEQEAEAPETPPIGVELDESFYDGIEIKAGEEADKGRESVAAKSAPRVAKTVSRHVVRRSNTQGVGSGTGSHPVLPAPSAPPPAADNGHGDDPLLRTNDYSPRRRATTSSRPVEAEPPDRDRHLPPALAAEIMDESPAPGQAEETGSSPLIDVMADFDRVDSSVRDEPLSNDLSLDLEGALDDTSWLDEHLPGPDVSPVDDEPYGELEIEAAPAPAAEPEAEPEPDVDVTTMAPAPRFDDERTGEPMLDVTGAELRLPEESQPDPDAVETDSVAELAELEQELERAQGEGQPSDERTARLRLFAGAAAERLGDFERAREHYDEALRGDERLAPAARALRRLAWRRGQFLEALRHLDLELELAGERERGALAAHRADLLLAAGEQDLARVAYGELTDARPDDVRSLLAQLELAWADDREDEVRDVLGAVARHVKDPELAAAMTVLRARLLESPAGDADDEAAAAYRAALETHPGERLALLGLTRLAQRAGRVDEAGEHRATFLARGASRSSAPDEAVDAATYRRRAAAWLASGSPEGAERALKHLEGFDLTGDGHLLDTLAAAQLAAGRHAEAATTLRTAAAVEGSAARRAELWLRVAAITGGPLGDATGALIALREAAAADPDDADSAAELADAALAAGDPDAAVALERDSAAGDPTGAPGAHLRAAALLARAGRNGEAVAELDAARLVAPDSAPVVDALARAFADAGRLDALAALWSEAAEIAACGPAAARERSARALEEVAANSLSSTVGSEDAVRAAEAAWRSLLELEPSALPAHAALARLAMARGDRAEAASALIGARTAGKDPQRRSALAAEAAALLAAAGDGAGAGAILDEALGEDAGDARAAARRILLGAGFDAAVLDASRVRAARAESLPDGGLRDAVRYAAAAGFAASGEPARASELLAPVVASRPGFSGASVLLEQLARRLGDRAALAARLEQELAATSDVEAPALRAARAVRHGEALFDLGEPGRAANLLREALAQRPDDPVLRDGFSRIAVEAREIAPLADLALADLARAEERGDAPGKLAAYEELARIDGDLRGDMASATLAWESAAAIDPTHLPALRALERTYLGAADGSRAADLGVVYGKLGAALASTPADAVPLLLERARLAESAGQPQAALDAHRDALALATSRMSLFRLEGRARDAGQLEEMAALDERIADYFSGDARGQAAFLARAGESLADLGRADEAIGRFRAAADIMPGFVPALRGWRRVALAAQPEARWAEAVEAAEREAQTARSDEERARLLHLAGSMAMDRAGDPERAARALRHVLAIDPGHLDAYVRLRRIFSADPAHAADLAELLTARVDLESHPGRLIELHATLAGLYRDVLGDPERAKAHLRAVLGRDPRNLAAVASLADVAWTQGRWSEAAEALIARARVEKHGDALKETFFRLGVIYDEKLPDRRWAVKSFERVLQLDPNDTRALEHLSNLSVAGGEWRTALGATERLVNLDTDTASRVTHLVRIGRILEQGFNDRKRSEDALRRALEVDPTSGEVLEAIEAFHNRAGDLATLRITLDRICAGMRARLERNAFDGVAYRVLARALTARGRAGVAGSFEAGRCAAELAVALGAGEEPERVLAQQAVMAPPNAKGLGLLHVDEILFHPAVPNGLRQLFFLLFDTLGKRFPADLRRAGVGRTERLPRAGHPVRETLARLAVELGVGEFEVYLTAARPNALAVELTDPMSIILGSGIAAGGPLELRFAGARAMKLARSYMALPASLGPEELGVLLAAVIRQHETGYIQPGVNPGAVGEEAQRLARLIPKRLRDEIVRFAAEISGMGIDHHALWLGTQHTGNRAGLIASGSVIAGLNVLRRIAGHRDLAAARGDAQVEELMRFAVSNEHCEVRAALSG